MTSHVRTRCQVSGPAAEVERLRRTVIVTYPDGDRFEFDRIIPVPAVINETEASLSADRALALVVARGSYPFPYSNLGLLETDIAWIRREAGLPREAEIYKVAAAFLAKRPDLDEIGRIRVRALAETGWADWYSWKIANWGTKWEPTITKS